MGIKCNHDIDVRVNEVTVFFGKRAECIKVEEETGIFYILHNGK